MRDYSLQLMRGHDTSGTAAAKANNNAINLAQQVRGSLNHPHAVYFRTLLVLRPFLLCGCNCYPFEGVRQTMTLSRTKEDKFVQQNGSSYFWSVNVAHFSTAMQAFAANAWT